MKHMLKVYHILAASIAVMSSPVRKEANATITRYEYKLTKDGYSFEYSTSNGITRKENGVYVRSPKSSTDDITILRVNGSYSYIDEKGEMLEVNYEANENGFSLQKPLESIVPLLISSSGTLFAGEYESRPEKKHGISSAALASLSGG